MTAGTGPARLLALHGSVRRYAWAHPTAMAEFLGGDAAAAGRIEAPAAELWFGTHASASATVESGGPSVPLAEVTGELPFLLKVLAIGAPLSIQVHPAAAAAAAGHARGDLPDGRAKPELLLALGSVRALAGVRPAAETLAALEPLFGAGSAEFAALFEHLSDDPRGGPGAALRRILSGPHGATQRLVEATAQVARRVPGQAARLVERLAAHHPGDPGILAALLLHDLELGPGQAIFLPPGVPHAYLAGLAVEVMASSDDVLRGGLTVKAVDRPGFLAAVDPTPARPPLFEPAISSSRGLVVRRFGPPVREFELLDLTVDGDGVVAIRPPAVLLGLAGTVVAAPPGGRGRSLERGQAAVAVGGERLALGGRGQVVIAQAGSAT